MNNAIVASGDRFPSPGPIGSSAGDLRIGADREGGNASYFFRGYLDEVRIWGVRASTELGNMWLTGAASLDSGRQRQYAYLMRGGRCGAQSTLPVRLFSATTSLSAWRPFTMPSRSTVPRRRSWLRRWTTTWGCSSPAQNTAERRYVREFSAD